MKTKSTIIIIILLFFCSIQAISQEIVETSFFKSNKELGGDVVINKSIIGTDNTSTYKTFEIESPVGADYYLSAWAKGGEFENHGSGNYMDYDLYVNSELQHKKFKPQINTWHSCEYKDNVSKALVKVRLNPGINTITFKCKNYLVPLIDFVKLSKTKAERNIPTTKFQNFVNEIKSNALNRKLNPVLQKDTLISLKNGTTYYNPAANYSHVIGATYKYTYYVGISKMAQQQLSITTTSNNFDYVVELFSKDHPELYSWVTTSTNGSASLNVTIPYTDLYYLRIRAWYQNEQDFVDVQINSIYYSDCIASGWAGFRCEHTPTRELNYFSCRTTGDTRLWVEKDDGVPGKIIGWDDDYSGSGDFDWGTDSRVKNQFSDDIAAILCSAFSSSTPSGTYNIYMKCRNANERLFQGMYYLTDYFSQLKSDDAIEAAPESSTYNCISRSGGATNYWEWPLTPSSQYYIPGDELGSFDDFYDDRNLTRSGATVSNAKVALWKKNSEFTHASVTKLANNHPHGYAWESKAGSLSRFFHPKDAVGGTDAYGSIEYYYQKDNTKSTALFDFGGMLLEEAIEKGLAVMADASYTPQELDYIESAMKHLPENIAEGFNKYFDNWLNSIKEPSIIIHSNPTMLKSNSAYEKLLNYCTTEGNILPLVFDKLQTTQFALFLLEDLAYEQNKHLMAEVKEENKAKLKSSSGAVIVNTPYTNSIKFAQKLMINNLLLEAKDELISLDKTVNNLKIYPNPATEKTTIKYLLLKDSEVNIAVVDISGKEILNIISINQNKGYHTLNVNLSGIEEGIYFCRFRIDNETFVHKLIIH